ncbi:exportin-6-like isoform X2 [Branchiostoma lanceolatum]|uniref:exportin-6-like isoform X2 n=1 Tax=Branchiostoma lanceolatum TaxID=7740 RepID=UPI0034550EF9
MASDEASLRALEGLLNEFFNGCTSNERKREIEQQLGAFGQQSGAWRHCFYFMSQTQNEYVMMYCLTVLENIVNKLWMGILGHDKMEIRTSLINFLMERHKVVAPYVRNKICKVIVDIGRIDWPHFYPDFFTNILQLIQQPETASLGLMMLQTTSEEMACPREDLSVARKQELHRLLLEQVPTVLSLLSGLLEQVLEKSSHMVTTATPPPSPNHDDSSNSSWNSSPMNSGSIISGMFQVSDKENIRPLPSLDHDSEHMSAQALQCLNHLFSWIPLSSVITPSLLITIFKFASFGCDPNSQGSPSGLSNFGGGRNGAGKTANLGILAMCCINEVMSKSCVPADFEEYLYRMFQQTFQLLQRLTREPPSGAYGNKLAELDEMYIDKFTEFLRLFVSVHLRRFESNSQFPVVDFLALLFKYTFKQPQQEGYYACLDVWMVFLDFLHNLTKGRNADGNNTVAKYKDALVTLMCEIVRKLQFRYNQAQLEELDDESLDDDEETEWQHFLRQCLEVVAKIAELLPEEAFRTLYPPFQEYLDIYLGLDQYVLSEANGRRLNITAENECRRLHCSLRDLGSMLQAIGRLAEHFIGEMFPQRLQDALSLVERLCQAAVYGTKLKLYDVNTAIPTVLRPDFIEVHAQSLAALHAYCHWLSQFYHLTKQTNHQQDKFASIVSTIVDASTPLLKTQIPEKVNLSAAHLFLSLVTTVRPSFLMALPAIQTLFSSVSHGAITTLPTEVQLLVCRALSHIFVLPWPAVGDNEQEWEARSSSHLNFLKELTKEYRGMKDMPGLSQDKNMQERAKPEIRRTLMVVCDLAESVAGEVMKTRQICYQSLQESVHTTLAILPVYIHQPDVVEDMMSFFLALFQSLRVQMGVSLTERIIQTFMNMFTREQLAETILHESSSGSRVIEKFLKILQLLVEEPGSAFKTFIPSIVSLCMDQVYPIIAERTIPDIKSVLFELLHHLLAHNWRFFFRSSVLDSMQSGTETVENQQQFSSIMLAFGQSFMQPDITIFKQNLEALESLNSKLKLYQKSIFKSSLLFQFLNVLLQVLVHRSHDLLREEIAIAVYNMASVDFDVFFTTFLPQFLSGCEGLDQTQKAILAQNFKMEKDLPSFTQSIHRFVNDLRYYRLCNSSLPEGTIKF